MTKLAGTLHKWVPHNADKRKKTDEKHYTLNTKKKKKIQLSLQKPLQRDDSEKNRWRNFLEANR